MTLLLMTKHPVLTVGPKPELIGAKYFELGEYYRSSLSKSRHFKIMVMRTE